MSFWRGLCRIWGVGDFGLLGGGRMHTHKEIVGVWVWSTDSEQLHQVMKLAVNISTNCNHFPISRINLDQSGLRPEAIPGCMDQVEDCVFFERHISATTLYSLDNEVLGY